MSSPCLFILKRNITNDLWCKYIQEKVTRDFPLSSFSCFTKDNIFQMKISFEKLNYYIEEYIINERIGLYFNSGQWDSNKVLRCFLPLFFFPTKKRLRKSIVDAITDVSDKLITFDGHLVREF
ncbi:MAG: hypothetical protein LBI18_10345 [Planctomycetaceae bacterium]|jgi:hypothetical protein|nr:hypothetical protein [Planctomycetaceae bacterium]